METTKGGVRAARAPRALAPRAGARVTKGATGVALHRLTRAQDLRGSLTAAEFSELPFQPQRLFTVFDVPDESVRGAHAHKQCAQFLVCVAGAVTCRADDGSMLEQARLDRADIGLYVPPMVWAIQSEYTRDAVLVILASHPYDPGDYIRDYDEFLTVIANRRRR